MLSNFMQASVLRDPGKTDEPRITKDVARYTSGFTPLNTSFPNS